MTMMMNKGSIDTGHAGPDESRWRAERPRRMSATSPDGHDELRLAEGTRCSACNEPLRCFPKVMTANFDCDRIHLTANGGDSPLVIRDGEKLGLVMPCAWNFGDSEKLETERRPAFARSGATPNA